MYRIDVFAEAPTAGLPQPGVGPQSTAVSLLVMAAGLGTSTLVAQRSPDSPDAVLADHLNRVFRSADAAG
ncbi:hypothetical protein ACIPIU_33450 [Streptomyces massasporeus]|uniref:hypothetical protein n=1 Tax=Streptomyces massasporeus TaxID=67324 RepID=UPI0038157849